MIKSFLIYASIPVISALIGWFTNWIAVKMIFRPRRPINILGFQILGLIPKRKADLAQKIAETVEKELISHRDIREILQTAEFQNSTGKVIRERINEFINTRIASNSFLTILLSPDLVSKLTTMLMEELQKDIPEMIDSLFSVVEQKIDFRSIIKAKIDGFDLGKFESIIYSISSKELKAIELLGGVLGFLIGLVQVAIALVGKIYA